MCNKYISLNTLYMRLLLCNALNMHMCRCTRVYVHIHRSLVKPLRGAFGDCLCEGSCNSASSLITVVHLLGPDCIILSPLQPSGGKEVPGTRRGRLRAAKSAPHCQYQLGLCWVQDPMSNPPFSRRLPREAGTALAGAEALGPAAPMPPHPMPHGQAC